MQNKPLVSVLMPCYNAEAFVEEALLSILNQTYRNLEVIAINDCSKDNTLGVLEKIAAKDSRVKIFNNDTNLKLIETLNKGIDLCSGIYIARMDADDISLPERIEKEVSFLEQNADYDIVSTNFSTFRTGKKKLYPHVNPSKFEDIQAFTLFKSCVCHPAVMIRKSMFSRFNLRFEEDYLHVEDYALWSKAVYLTKIANINESLLHYRVHGSQISTKHEQEQLENKKKVFIIHCNHLGLRKDPEFLDIYASVAESVPKESSFEYLEKCESFMLDLIDLNKRKPFCSHTYLQNMLSLHWLRCCANSRLGLKVLKKCFSSTLYRKENYKTQDYIILYVKCIFRMEYKKSFIYKLIFR
ncbi:glycosyltransferase family 2 protein [Dysgonomonas sp. 520]|uniref:glycosyltransferase family 2 protein n=1 Tax=Dysgonomonas sp. 520 TaxID=2302931 RepID=UPI0013D48AA1|nr:glycosyltransferase family 2 protein [Dysgonomonas sp. 520]NDW09238.1 glycosyltransferase family 2 protein [Dysgonomonas sp. 520]